MAEPFRFDGSWRFALDRAELWSVLASTDEYAQWWSWLRAFEPAPLEPGAVAHATIGPPLPYVLSVGIQIVDVEPAARVDAMVTGDLRGPAVLLLSDDGDGGATVARLQWTLTLHHRGLRPATRLMRPVLEWGHRWVVDTGVRQFRRTLEGTARGR